MATANNNTLAPGERRAIGFDWRPPFRVNRIREVLRQARGHTAEDSAKLQGDVTSLAAREMLRFVQRIAARGDARQRAITMLRDWDGSMTLDSGPAALYEAWVKHLSEDLILKQLPAELRQVMKDLGFAGQKELLTILHHDRDDKTYEAEENQALGAALDEAVAELGDKLGSDWSVWRWGALHSAQFQHPLATNAARAALLNRGPVERPGDGTTINATAGPDFSQTSGATYREVLDLADWDRSLAMNAPGQSGQPESLHYDDLLMPWARNEHFPLLYSRGAVEKQAKEKLLLVPATNQPK